MLVEIVMHLGSHAPIAGSSEGLNSYDDITVDAFIDEDPVLAERLPPRAE